MGTPVKEVRSRKFMLVFQSSHILEDGWTHDTIRKALEPRKLQYWAMCDEVASETGQLHTHLIIYRKSPLRASTLREMFPSVHMEPLKGTMAEARTYLLKEGKYAGTDKAETSIEGSFEEWGEPPEEKGQGARSDLEAMMEMVRNGSSDLEIIEAVPSLVLKISAIQRYRQLVMEESAHNYRKMQVFYIYGVTGSGKTRSVYDEFKDDPSCIYTINSYNGTGLFDGYDSSKVTALCLDEFRSSLPFNLLLSLTDGHFQIINCRYSNRIATHTTVYIISNIPLYDQYKEFQKNEPESWRALLRRITTIRHFYAVGKHQDYTVEEYYDAYRKGRLEHWEPANRDIIPFKEEPLHKTSKIKEVQPEDSQLGFINENFIINKEEHFNE